MAGFTFKFQSMLNVKEKLQEQKELEFGKAVQAYELEKRKFDILVKQREANILGLKDAIEKKVSPREIASYNSFINKLKNDMDKQKVTITQAEEYVEKKRLELQNAIVETKKYEKLKEKDLEEYVLEQKSKENQALDEIVTYRFTNSDED